MWSAGVRGDARHVAGVLREKFSRDEKQASRLFVADYFRSVGARSIVDLWGGGQSAEAMLDAIPSARVISVENGSVCGSDWFVDRLGRPISRERLQRAHRVMGDEAGYEVVWGDVALALGEPVDAIWLDFCSQWHPRMARTIELAGAQTDHLALTVMPERDGLGSLGLSDRLLALTAIVAGHADMVPAYVGSYHRNDLGQDMALLVFDRRSASGDGFEATTVLPRHILKGISKRGSWVSRRFHKRRCLSLMKCSRCSRNFTYRPPDKALGMTCRSKCDDCFGPVYVPRHVGKPCQTCGQPIAVKYRRSYCSDACDPRVVVKAPCLSCGQIVPPGRRSVCSDKCYQAHRERYEKARHLRRHPSVTVICPCGTSFVRQRFGPRKFCSDRCRRSSQPHSVYVPRRCVRCGGFQKHPTKLCRECRLVTRAA